MASSWAWSSGVCLQDICLVAGWSFFASFYNIDFSFLTSQIFIVKESWVHLSKAHRSLIIFPINVVKCLCNLFPVQVDGIRVLLCYASLIMCRWCHCKLVISPPSWWFLVLKTPIGTALLIQHDWTLFPIALANPGPKLPIPVPRFLTADAKFVLVQFLLRTTETNSTTRFCLKWCHTHSFYNFAWSI